MYLNILSYISLNTNLSGFGLATFLNLPYCYWKNFSYIICSFVILKNWPITDQASDSNDVTNGSFL